MIEFCWKSTFNNFFHVNCVFKFVNFLPSSFSYISVLLFKCFDFFIECFLESLSFFLSLTSGLVSQFLSTFSNIITIPLFGFHFCFEIFDLLTSLPIIKLKPIELFACILQLFFSINAITNSLLILFEEDLVFGFDVFSLRKTIASYTEVMLKFGNLMLISINFSNIVLDIMSGGWVLMKLSLGANRFKSFFPVEIGSFCFGRTSGDIVRINVSPLGHNDNIIQIKLSIHPIKGVYSW